MRVEVDRKRCEGHGVCAANAPNLFRLDDDGELRLTYEGTDIPAEEHDNAEVAATGCPVEALRRAESADG
jgi:ferredoxin